MCKLITLLLLTLFITYETLGATLQKNLDPIINNNNPDNFEIEVTTQPQPTSDVSKSHLTPTSDFVKKLLGAESAATQMGGPYCPAEELIAPCTCAYPIGIGSPGRKLFLNCTQLTHYNDERLFEVLKIMGIDHSNLKMDEETGGLETKSDYYPKKFD